MSLRFGPCHFNYGTWLTAGDDSKFVVRGRKFRENHMVV